MTSRLVAAVAAAIFSAVAAAPAAAQGVEVSGFVDTYYSYNANKPDTSKAGVERTFDVQHNSFSLNLIELALAKNPTSDSRGGFHFDLDFGPTQAIVNAAEPGDKTVLQHIGQAYLSYLAPAGGGLQIDVGKWVTQHGAEVIKTKDDWNYSRSLLFTLAIPFYHTGVRATYTVNDKVTLLGNVSNGWNNVVDNNTGKTVGAQIVYKPVSSLSIVQNYMGGPEQANNNSDWRHLSDTTVTYTVNPQVSLIGNYDYGQDKESGAKVKWQGFAGYVKYQPTSWFALSPRAEYYNDTEGFTSGQAQKLKEFTVTGEFKHKDGVLMRLEYRYDKSDLPFFQKHGDLAKDQNTFAVGVIYAFNTKVP